ncbi:hypothetical protein S245_034877, partial [Arachis hypogaea]
LCSLSISLVSILNLQPQHPRLQSCYLFLAGPSRPLVSSLLVFCVLITSSS